jgi:hypothetical protein
MSKTACSGFSSRRTGSGTAYMVKAIDQAPHKGFCLLAKHSIEKEYIPINLSPVPLRPKHEHLVLSPWRLPIGE